MNIYKDIYNHIISFLPLYQRVYLQKKTILYKKEWDELVHEKYKNDIDYHYYLSEINESRMLKYALIECSKKQTEIMDLYNQIINKPWKDVCICIPIKSFLEKVKPYHFNGVNMKWMIPKLYLDIIGRPMNQYEALPHSFNYFNELKIMYYTSKLLEKTKREPFFLKIMKEIVKKLDENWDWICRYHFTDDTYIKGSFTFFNKENDDEKNYNYNNYDHIKHTCYVFINCNPIKKKLSSFLLMSFLGNILSYSFQNNYNNTNNTNNTFEYYETPEFLEKNDFLENRFFIHHTF